MTAILLLNASYEPLSIIPQRRALSLLMRERVDAATDHAITIQGVGGDFDIPSVMRLRRYISVPRRGARWSRKAVLQRDGFQCIYCGVEAGQRRKGITIKRGDFTVDHIIPRSRGGRSTWSNTACACPDCNNRKANRTPHEANMAMRWEPKMPRVNYLIASGDIPAAWKIYLEV